MKNLLPAFWRDESGATAIEYGLIATLVCIALLSGLLFFGDSMVDLYAQLEAAVGGATGSAP